MSTIDSEDAKMPPMTSLVSKFRGCLIGGLIGDCLGAPFEGDQTVTKSLLTNFLTKRLDERHKREIKRSKIFDNH